MQPREAERLRLACVEALDASAKDGVAAPVNGFVARAEASPAASVPAVAALIETVKTEVLMGLLPENFAKWGSHYCRTLPLMLRAERRSNFRDKALQHFGKDAAGEEALFEASRRGRDDLRDAQGARAVAAAPPSGPAMGVPVAAGAAPPATPQTAAPRGTVLPDEYAAVAALRPRASCPS